MYRLSTGLAAYLLAATPFLQAQDTIPLSTDIPALTVTAQKRSERLIDVPVAVTALNSEQITASRTLSLNDLNGLVPNYQHKQIGVGFQALQSIRGIQIFSENPAVATYVDGVNYLDILAGGFPLIDVERIEVLRGPQGTLYGRNAMGGVVNVITKSPGNQPELSALAEMGNLGHGRFAVNYRSPLVKDRLFLSAGGLYQTDNGFLTNDTTGVARAEADAQGQRLGDQQTIYGSAKLTYLPSTSFSLALDVKAQRDWSDASTFFVQQSSDVAALARPDVINLGVVGNHDRRIVTAALTAKYYGAGYTLESITAGQRINLAFADIESGGFRYSTLDATTLGGFPDPQVVWSQELRVASTGNGPLSYTAGLYGFHQNAFEPTTNLAIELGPDFYGVTRNASSNYGAAAFGELRYQITNKLQVTGGLRYDVEHRVAEFNGFGDLVLTGGQFNELVADTSLSGDYSALSPRLAVRYQPNPNSTLYASYSRGFRAGGINTRRAPLGALQTFDPEFSNNYEVGYKVALAKFPLSLAATAFWIDWTDLQFFNVLPNMAFARTNVGDATSRGLELEVSTAPLAQLRIDVSAGYNETQYEDFLLSRFTGETNVGGNRLSNAPIYTGYAAVTYDVDLGKDWLLQPRLDYRRVGEQFTDIQNDIRVTPYGVANARLALSHGRYTLSLWGRNLTDERYLAYGSPDSSFTRRSTIAPPRTYGLTIQYN